MKLYLVRHGKTDWNLQGRIQGQADIPLNSIGIQQAEALRDKIAERGLKFDAVYASPLQRTAKTAEIITSGPIVFDNRLKERAAGDFTGQPLGMLFNHEIDFLDPNLNAGDYGVEPFLDFQGRATDFLECLRANHPNDARILIVTSNGIMKRMHAQIHGDLRAHPHFQNAEIYEYEL